MARPFQAAPGIPCGVPLGLFRSVFFWPVLSSWRSAVCSLVSAGIVFSYGLSMYRAEKRENVSDRHTVLMPKPCFMCSDNGTATVAHTSSRPGGV